MIKDLSVAPLLAKEFNRFTLGVNDKCQLEKTEQIYQNNNRQNF
jgi:bifunctional N-acetylglucosamine-1-phosphate-uridyltransferase/glucosamine-1-phosphate-acetyltransferase GlmU-like protein